MSFPSSSGLLWSEMKVTQLCLTLRDPMDCNPPGSSIHGIFQARILESVAIAFSKRSSRSRDRTGVSWIAGRFFTVWATTSLKVKVKSLSHIRLFATPWTVAYQASPSMAFSRQEYWSGYHFLLQAIFPMQGLNPGLPHCRQTLYRLSHQGTHFFDHPQI